RDLRQGETERKWQSGDTCWSAEDGRISASRGPAAARLLACGRAPGRDSIKLPQINGMNKAQTARSCILPTERRRSNSRGSLRIVSGLAEDTNSIFCDGPSRPETANGCLVLPSPGTDAERHTVARRTS